MCDQFIEFMTSIKPKKSLCCKLEFSQSEPERPKGREQKLSPCFPMAAWGVGCQAPHCPPAMPAKETVCNRHQLLCWKLSLCQKVLHASQVIYNFMTTMLIFLNQTRDLDVTGDNRKPFIFNPFFSSAVRVTSIA